MHGSCLCGDVEFEVLEPPHKMYQCHCSLCRKQSGTASNAAFIVTHEQMKWRSGEKLIASYNKPTGFRSVFCSRCGSPLPNRIGATQYTWVPVGLLEATADLQIALHLHVSSKAQWEQKPGVGKLHREMPSLDEILKTLNQTTED